MRVHHRAMMEAAGLQSIIRQCRGFAVEGIEKQLNVLQQNLDDDEQKLKERMDEDILRDLANPEDVFNALKAKTQDSKARDYLLSMMQHLLLIREEGPALAYYFQIIDGAVTDLVMDKQLGGGEARLGRSVDRIIAQFNEADRYQHVEDELAKAHATALRLRLEKEALEEEIAQGGEGLVQTLKQKVSSLEDKLQVSRDSTAKLQSHLQTQKNNYEEQIAQLEAQIMELFRRLREVGKGVDKIMENSGSMDRKTLIDTLEKHLQRDKTISILEGRDRRRRDKANGNGGDDQDSEGTVDEEETPTKAGSLRRRAASSMKRSKSNRVRVTEAHRGSEAQGGRTSQFMDADEAMVQEQIQQQLAQGVKIVSLHSIIASYSIDFPRSTPHEMVRLTAQEASEGLLGGKTTLVHNWASSLPRHQVQMVCFSFHQMTLGNKATIASLQAQTLRRVISRATADPGQQEAYRQLSPMQHLWHLVHLRVLRRLHLVHWQRNFEGNLRSKVALRQNQVQRAHQHQSFQHYRKRRSIRMRPMGRILRHLHLHLHPRLRHPRQECQASVLLAEAGFPHHHHHLRHLHLQVRQGHLLPHLPRLRHPRRAACGRSFLRSCRVHHLRPLHHHQRVDSHPLRPDPTPFVHLLF